MNSAYFGSPLISANLLEDLLAQNNSIFSIPLVVTQADKRTGKSLSITPTPVKKVALEHNLSIFDKHLQTKESALKDILIENDIDLCIVYAYGNYISPELLKVPKYGFWNIHPSLLPLYRGPSPIAFPIMMNDSITGVSLIQLSDILDGGPILLQESTHIGKDELRFELENKLTKMSTNIIVEGLSKLQNNTLIKTIQDNSKASQSFMLQKESGFITKEVLIKALNKDTSTSGDYPFLLERYISKYPELSLSLPKSLALNIYNYYRALTPWPGIWTKVLIKGTEKRLKIIQMEFKNEKLNIKKVQLEGKNEVDFIQFNEAYEVFK